MFRFIRYTSGYFYLTLNCGNGQAPLKFSVSPRLLISPLVTMPNLKSRSCESCTIERKDATHRLRPCAPDLCWILLFSHVTIAQVIQFSARRACRLRFRARLND